MSCSGPGIGVAPSPRRPVPPADAHEHVFSKLISASRGLATLRCGCGKLKLEEYRDGAQLAHLTHVLRKNRLLNRSADGNSKGAR